jgi:hypothetical protein
MYHLQTYVFPGLLPTPQAYSLTLGLLLNPQVYIAVFTTHQYLPLDSHSFDIHDLYQK